MECKKEVILPAIFAALACSRRIQKDWGHLLENFVFTELRRSYDIIEYYRTEGGQEVDFLVTPLMAKVGNYLGTRGGE